MRLGVDPRKADQMVRGTVNLPHGTGKTARVLVFANGDKAEAAREAGADFVGCDDLIEKVAGGWLDFDAVVATPDMMGKVGRLGKVLGPRGLMPNPKTGTVTMDVAKAVTDIKGGKIEFRVDKHANLHFIIGKASFDEKALVENYARRARGDPASEAVGLQGPLHHQGDDDDDDGPRHPAGLQPHPQPAGRGRGHRLKAPDKFAFSRRPGPAPEPVTSVEVTGSDAARSAGMRLVRLVTAVPPHPGPEVQRDQEHTEDVEWWQVEEWWGGKGDGQRQSEESCFAAPLCGGGSNHEAPPQDVQVT